MVKKALISRGDGKIYKGYWKDGVQHGNGFFIDDDGATNEGIWEYGKNVKWIKEDEGQEEIKLQKED